MSKNRERLWVPEIGVEAPVKKADVHFDLPMGSIAGFVKLELIEAATGIVKECHEFPNIILTAGLDGLMDGRGMNSMLTTMTVGTGSTPVSPSDLSLDEEVEQSSDNGGILDVFGYQTGSGGGQFDLGNPYHFIQRTRVFTENEANFPALSELGWRSLGSPDFQFTRTLFKDVTGSVITIEKTDQDQLRITYEIRGYPPAQHTTGSFVLLDSEASHSFTSSGIDIDRADTGRSWTFSLRAQAGPDPRGFFFEVGNFGGGGVAGVTPFASASAPANPTGTTNDWGGWTGGQIQSVSQSFEPEYVSGSLVRSNKATWEPSEASFASGGIQGMVFKFTGASNAENILAMYFTPSIKKTDLQRFTLTYNVSLTASLTSSA